MSVRAVRGAITVEHNTREEILSATTELLTELVKVNSLGADDIISMIFTMTPDLNAVFPAEAARTLGYEQTPLLCSQELNISGALAKVIRILIHFNCDQAANELKAVYLKDAAGLRPDIASE